MTIQRVALIFDHEFRPETTGVYVRRALGQMVEVEHFLPSEIGRIPADRFDLFLNIDDGLRYRLPSRLKPSAWWAIDTHMDLPWCAEKSRDFDFVFAAQRDGAASPRKAGIDSATWLPLACDPEIHSKHDVPKTTDLCFIGNVLGGERAELLELLKGRFPEMLIDQRYFEEMAETFSSSRIVFNRSIRNDLNMRLFEAVACGSLLLTNDLRDNGQEELFQDGVHLATYRDADELLDKVAYYLEHDEIREQIAAAGRAEALERHTYQHRMQFVLQAIEQQLSKTTIAVSAPKADLRDRSYFAHVRPEILALVPSTAKRVLDIGCGAGRLGEAIKARQQAHVVGVELDRDAAAEASGRLGEVIVGNAEELTDHFENGSFDCIVCGDILEHLREPEKLLERMKSWLADGGSLVASIPNVRHHSVITSLLDGNWTYESAGLLDRDHVRFFTRREIEKLLFRCGFAIDRLQVVPGPGYEEWRQSGRLGEVKVGSLQIAGLAPEDAEEFYVYQYLVVATPAARPKRELTSIVLVTYNQLDYTRLCVDSIFSHTDEPYELIFVDNGSTDGTLDYLRSLPKAKVIANPDNRGFPVAANQGMQVAEGAYVLLLNNDCVVTTGWLHRLLNALESDPSVGLVGPCSNNVSGEQQVPVRYSDLIGMDGFAWDWARRNRGNYRPTDRLIGFCLLIRREVIDRIGLLDERFGIGCFEDDDYCLRALQAGFRALIAYDVFIHHFGSRTFFGSGVDFGGVLQNNERLFREKWGQTVEESNPVAIEPPESAVELPPSKWALKANGNDGLLLERSDIRLSLCMIVRNNAGTIEPCLESIRPWVDEMIVVDTGSTDDTPKLSAERGARLFHLPWPDDFSAARNESLRHARGEWVFWMDSDDTISEECGRKLRELVYRNVPDSLLGYVMQVHCPATTEHGEVDVTVVDHVKLFRNRPDLQFEGRIHEQILPAIRRADGDVAWSDVYVVHSGSDRTPEGQARKLERDFKLLELDLAERPDHPFVLFNFGMTHADAGQHEKAVEYLTRSITVASPGESHLRKAYALLVSSLAASDRHEDAWDACQRGRALFSQDAELRFREAMLHHHFGRFAEAEKSYQAALHGREERHFSSVVEGIQGYKARHNLAVVLGDKGDLHGAEQQWRLILNEKPDYRPAWRGLAEVFFRQGRLSEVEQLADRLLHARDLSSAPELTCEANMLLARASQLRGDLERARNYLQAALNQSPDDTDCHEARCRFHFEHGTLAESQRALHELLQRQPKDPAAYHNLGTVYLRAGEHDRAAAAYRESLQLRPNSATTYLHLGYALRDGGALNDAMTAWQEASRLAPDDAAVSEALAAAHHLAAVAGSEGSVSQ